jgi:GNAT superfamily N-acetyltransferase
MENEFTIKLVDQPGAEEWGAIGGGIGAYNEAQAGSDATQRVCYMLHDSEGEIAGGIIAGVHYEWLSVDLLWVRDELRRQGYGSRLLALAEDKARELGAENAYLDTFSFQGPEFYAKQGYEVFGELPDFPPGHRRFYLRKEL